MHIEALINFLIDVHLDIFIHIKEEPNMAIYSFQRPLGAVLCAAALWCAAPAMAQEPVQPIVAAKVTQPGQVELGKKLWFDPRLSKSSR